MKRREFLALIGSAAVNCLAPSARAQSDTRRLALLTLDPDEDLSAVSSRLEALGFVEGKNLSVSRRSAEGDPKRLLPLAQELVREKPDVMLAGWGTLAPQALKAATSSIPIVFSSVGDPVGAGLVENLARPGANLTGFSGQATEFKGKQLQLLKEAVPGQSVVGVLCNPDTPYTPLALKELRAAAVAEGTRLELLEIRTPEELSLASMETLIAAGATSLFVLDDPLIGNIRNRVVELATRLSLPIMAGQRQYAPAGALLTYGTDRDARYRRAAEYIDKILRGTHPGDLPVEQPTKFSLVVNLKAARLLAIPIPHTLLARADEVIE
jgi:putative tryptophan/tyrosine transport system substrate-binding protein